jgi:hypothetical protein
MRRASIRIVVFLALFLPFMASPPGFLAQSRGGDGRPDQATLQPISGIGLASATGYLSAPTEAAHPFTHMLLRREAHVPEGAGLALAVRVSNDGAAWTGWHDITDNDDLWMDADGPDVEWSQTIDVGAVVRFWQVRALFTPSPSGALPDLRRIDVNTVDTYAFAPARPPVLTNDQPTATMNAKPRVVSRLGWGSPDGEGSRVPADYYPVNHMVIHHTADSNTLLGGETSWADRVRAEWAFHTYTRGWGDVGYNYLIDPNGVIYEGRAGGDDAVAFHDTANYGSMGVVLIGTYADVPPTAATQNALVGLLAWKAAQKGIDPLGSSYYYGCAISKYCYPYNAGAIVPNIAGHRQVTPGHTSCPGDGTILNLPGIRNRVKQALNGGSSDNGDLTIDELESGFDPSISSQGASWHEASCGYGSHTYWTYATDNPAESTNRAIWRPNIPTTGSYHVYAHIPQGCGLASPPYASATAKYLIHAAGGDQPPVQVDHNTAEEWVSLGVYTFNSGNNGYVKLADLAGEPFGANKVIFFDAVKWVPENSGSTNVQLLGVTFDRTSVASGELLKVTFTVKNSGTTTLHTQEPQAGTAPDGAFNDGQGRPDDSYAYDEGECFNGDSAGSYAAYPKESDRFRVILGPTDTSGIACAGAFGSYPWRWGLNGDLAPGKTRNVVGYVRFRNSGTTNRTLTLQAGIIQEYVKYYQQGVNPQTITVLPEQIAPDSASYDASLNPLAQVYQLGDVPDNLLARTRNPLSVPRGAYLGSFAWNGTFIDWGTGGPLPGLTDQFLIEQTRVFLAPTSGLYTFDASSDDGSWLWVDGQPVIVNNGLHSADDLTGTISLSAGAHTLAFKYFERSGLAAAGYSVQMPGEHGFQTLADGLGGGAQRVGKIFFQIPHIRVAADDAGGSGVDRIRWSLDDGPPQDSPGRLLDLGMLQNKSSYHLRYMAVDAAGNQGVQRDLYFAVNTNMTIYRKYLPIAGR